MTDNKWETLTDSEKIANLNERLHSLTLANDRLNERFKNSLFTDKDREKISKADSDIDFRLTKLEKILGAK